jgi:hypothetical protein
VQVTDTHQALQANRVAALNHIGKDAYAVGYTQGMIAVLAVSWMLEAGKAAMKIQRR